jgi:MFS family permease
MLVPRWVEVRLGMSREAVTWLMLPFIPVNLVGFFFFNWLGKRIGKFNSLIWVFVISAVLFCLFGWSDRLGLSRFACAQLIAGLSGLPVAGFGVLAFALLADVIDADFARTRIHREAVYFGVQAIVQKSMIGLSVVTFSQLEGSLGLLGLRWISLMAGGLCLLGLLGFLGYRPRLIKFRVSSLGSEFRLECGAELNSEPGTPNS